MKSSPRILSRRRRRRWYCIFSLLLVFVLRRNYAAAAAAAAALPDEDSSGGEENVNKAAKIEVAYYSDDEPGLRVRVNPGQVNLDQKSMASLGWDSRKIDECVMRKALQMMVNMSEYGGSADGVNITEVRYYAKNFRQFRWGDENVTIENPATIVVTPRVVNIVQSPGYKLDIEECRDRNCNNIARRMFDSLRVNTTTTTTTTGDPRRRRPPSDDYFLRSEFVLTNHDVRNLSYPFEGGQQKKKGYAVKGTELDRVIEWPRSFDVANCTSEKCTIRLSYSNISFEVLYDYAITGCVGLWAEWNDTRLNDKPFNAYTPKEKCGDSRAQTEFAQCLPPSPLRVQQRVHVTLYTAATLSTPSSAALNACPPWPNAAGSVV